jgi:hypothetical protein
MYQRSGVVLRESINFIFFTSTLLADYPSLEPIEETIIQTPHPASPVAPLANEPSPPQPTRIAWSQWGEKTRLTMWRMPTSCYTICVSGTRVVRRLPAHAPRQYKIQVCDFNPYAAVDEVQVAMPGKPAVSTQQYIHARQNNVFKNTLLFEDSLYGFLPYLEVTTRSTFEMEEVMIDADNIYLVHVSPQFCHVRSLRGMVLTVLSLGTLRNGARNRGAFVLIRRIQLCPKKSGNASTMLVDKLNLA